ncbi:hypothetical protein FH972_025056 [Carpinus fangiana]|uniref:Uncharacterized protein n=1 Tax=Carpinus fangiana TaxID=176857 RepID=A0A5N6L0U0_9ROSI|nr:hypothetical protein FH972_025056 [Carpinus fangiana]
MEANCEAAAAWASEATEAACEERDEAAESADFASTWARKARTARAWECESCIFALVAIQRGRSDQRGSKGNGVLEGGGFCEIAIEAGKQMTRRKKKGAR